MSVLEEGLAPGGDGVDPAVAIPRLDFELTPACDHRCAHCYNVWTAEPGDAQAGYDTAGQLATPDLLALMSKAVAQTGCQHITLTGGEPLLRKDALEIVEHACNLVRTVTLITNGSHIDGPTAARLHRAGVTSVQLTLLSPDREEHDRLKGATCFDDTVRAALELTEAGVGVQVCFVAMRANAGRLRGVLELCLALGVRAISYNRMSPTGGAIHHVARLLPDIEMVEADLDVAEQLGRQLGIRVATAMPIPPCLIRLDRYSWVKFGYCSTGSHSPNVVIDAAGTVRSCNLSSNVLGNLRDESWAQIHARPYPREFRRRVPAMCRGCRYERSCQGGCKESGFATFGDHEALEPFLRMAVDPTWRAQVLASAPDEGESDGAVVPLRRLKVRRHERSGPASEPEA